MKEANALELLTPQRHASLRMRSLGIAPTHFVPVSTREFAAAAAFCPVLFSKDAATGRFYAGAMLGMKAGENLVGTADDRGGFTPLLLQRQGFFLSGEHVAIDRSDARFSEADGELMFDDSGQPAPALRTVQRVLGEIHAGSAETDAFVNAMTLGKLIEPIDISLAFSDGEKLTLQGLYCVSLDRLQQLDDTAALALFRAGHLQHAYTMRASLQQIPRLARLRDRPKAR
jgi:hypothetical protein